MPRIIALIFHFPHPPTKIEKLNGSGSFRLKIEFIEREICESVNQTRFSLFPGLGSFLFFYFFFCKCVEDVSDISESRKKFFAFLPASVLYHHRVETFTRLRIKSSFEEKNRQEYFRIESLPYEIKGAE